MGRSVGMLSWADLLICLSWADLLFCLSWADLFQEAGITCAFFVVGTDLFENTSITYGFFTGAQHTCNTYSSIAQTFMHRWLI
jgi:hypothetical protein